MPDTAEYVDELATRLFAIDSTVSTAALTGRITAEVARWARSRGWHVHEEARIDVSPLTTVGVRGFVDVIVRRASDRDIAIEIDSTDKAWSLAKLRYLAGIGMHAIWVRWGDDEWAGVHEDVDIIQLPVVRRSAVRRPTPQLRLWTREL